MVKRFGTQFYKWSFASTELLVKNRHSGDVLIFTLALVSRNAIFARNARPEAGKIISCQEIWHTKKLRKTIGSKDLLSDDVLQLSDLHTINIQLCSWQATKLTLNEPFVMYCTRVETCEFCSGLFALLFAKKWACFVCLPRVSDKEECRYH